MYKGIIAALKVATGLPANKISLEATENEEFGDYSSNIALTMFSKFQIPNSKFLTKFKIPDSRFKNPQELAEEIVKKLTVDRSLKAVVDRIEVAGPGFINFWLSKDALINNLIEIDKQKEKYGNINILSGKKIMIEFGQPNTHKLPHIGHLFSYIYGESLARLMEKAGAKVFRANYQGDIGLHVAKCLWAFAEEKVKTPKSLEGKTLLLQEMYVKGNKAYDQGGKEKDEIVNLNLKIYQKDKLIIPLWQETRNWSVDYYKKFEDRLGIKFDKYYFESEVYKKGIDIVKKNLGEVFKESQDAVIFEGSKYGLHDRVFLTKQGTPTYEAKDLALQSIKYQDWPFDLLIITTANEQNDYFKVVFKALETIDPKFKDKLKHIGFGMVNLKGGKLSSREGTIIGAVELVDKIVSAIKSIVEQGRGLTEVEKKFIAESAGIGAVKHSFLKNNPLQNISFDIDETISKEGNSGPYLQYTYARTQSVLAKVKTQNLNVKTTTKNSKLNNRFLDLSYGLNISDLTFKLKKEELSLLRSLFRFSGVVADAVKNYSPNIICAYLFDLTRKFNNFYAKYRIIGSKNLELRLRLTTAVGQVLKTGLKLLGIEVLPRM